MKTITILLGVLAVVFAARAADVPAVPAPLEQPPDRPGLVITADLMIVLLRSNMVYYSNNVVVTDPPAKPGDPPTVLKCRELTGTRGTNGRLEAIVAEGSVDIQQGDMKGVGNRAVYTATNEIMILTGGHPDSGTNRPMLYTGAGFTNIGDTVIYDRNSGRLVTRGNVITILPPSALKTATNSPGAKTNTARPRRAFDF